MVTLGNCDIGTCRSIKVLFKLLLQDAFINHFGFSMPSSLMQIRDLAFVPHLLNLAIPWRRVPLDTLRTSLQLNSVQWDACLCSPVTLNRNSDVLVKSGKLLLGHRVKVRQTIPTRLRVLFSWNMSSWGTPDRPKMDPKMRRCKQMLKRGPVCLQETKWSGSQRDALLQHIPGVQIAETLAIRNRNGRLSGGTAILIPTGFVLKDSHVLVQGKAVVALVEDRGSQFYLLSVYLHPDAVRQDLSSLLEAWESFSRNDVRVVATGDFNRADERCPELWQKWLSDLQIYDVSPTLGTFRHPGGLSPLDRCLAPEDWISTARWNPSVHAIEPRGTQGHCILKMRILLKPTVINCPQDPKHDTIPSNVFMPGKNGNVPKDVSEVYSLVRLLHQQRHTIFQHLPNFDGFQLGGHTTLSGIGDIDYKLQPIQMCPTDPYRCTPLQVLSDGTFLHEDRALPGGDGAPTSRCQVVHLPDFDVGTDYRRSGSITGE